MLRAIFRPGAVGLVFLVVQDNACPHVCRACRQFLDDESGGDFIFCCNFKFRLQMINGWFPVTVVESFRSHSITHINILCVV